MKSEHLKLWQKIAEFPLDDPDATRPFSVKLAEENKWTEVETLRRIVEYKKFIFLCVTLPNGASPSPEVDKVWHLHLTYTENYWNQFCRNVLEIQLHHHPSKGGHNEKNKHDDWYKNTLIAYVEIFEHIPPDDIWHYPLGFSPQQYLPPNSPFLLLDTEGVLTSDINTDESYSLATTPILQYLIYTIFALLGLVLLIPPLLVGTTFLIPYFILFTALCIHLYLNSVFEKEKVARKIGLLSNKFSPYIAAWIMGGKERLITLFLYQTTTHCHYTPKSEDIAFDLSTDKKVLTNPLFISLQAINKKNISVDFIKETIRPYWQLVEREVTQKGFKVQPSDNNNYSLIALFIMVGCVRLIEGICFHRPFGILLMLIVICLVVLLLFNYANKISFNDWRNSFRQKYSSTYQHFVGESDVWQFAFGSTILANIVSWYTLEQSLRPPQYSHTSGDGGSSSCGGSSCGGSSCGGGCGGGCGGCGG